MLTPEPQAFAGAPRGWYDNLQAVNSSMLKVLHQGPPLRAYLQFLDPDREPQDDAPHFRIGTMVHMGLLEPEELERVQTCTMGPTTKGFKEAKAAAEADGLMLVQEKEKDAAEKLVAAVAGHAVLGPLFHPEQPDHRTLFRKLNELTLTWLDPVTRVRCKARLDAIRAIQGMLWVLDLKTTADATPGDFGKSVANYSYLIQGAFYADALFHCRAQVAELVGVDPASWIGVPIGFEFIAIDKGTPCSSMVGRYWMEESHFEMGRHLYRDALNTAAACMSTGYWPGLSTAAQPLALPRWYRPIDDG